MTPIGPRKAILALLLTAACATQPQSAVPASKSVPSDVDRIEYSIGRCRGTCPAYRFSIASDGIAFFEGEVHTAATGRSPVDAGPTLFRSIRDVLAVARPEAPERTVSAETCTRFYTDQQVVTVEWTGATTRRLSFDLGCQDEGEAAVRQALSAARRLMPIDAQVGSASRF